MTEAITPGRDPQPPTRQAWILPANQLTLLYGHSGVGRMPHYFLPHALLEGRQALYLDGANRFDPLLMARFARDRRLPPAEFNRLIRVARAFTCFQLTELLRRVPKFLGAFPADFLIVTALPDLYFDEDVREREAAFAFERALEALRTVMPSPLAIGVFSEALSFNTPRRTFFRKLVAQADSVRQIDMLPGNRAAFRSIKEGPLLPLMSNG
jgi:hypothetical protein